MLVWTSTPLNPLTSNCAQVLFGPPPLSLATQYLSSESIFVMGTLGIGGGCLLTASVAQCAVLSEVAQTCPPPESLICPLGSPPPSIPQICLYLLLNTPQWKPPGAIVQSHCVNNNCRKLWLLVWVVWVDDR